jgi:hypothetical protein
MLPQVILDTSTLWGAFRNICLDVATALWFELLNALLIVINALVLGLNWWVCGSALFLYFWPQLVSVPQTGQCVCVGGSRVGPFPIFLAPFPIFCLN